MINIKRKLKLFSIWKQNNKIKLLLLFLITKKLINKYLNYFKMEYCLDLLFYPSLIKVMKYLNRMDVC